MQKQELNLLKAPTTTPSVALSSFSLGPATSRCVFLWLRNSWEQTKQAFQFGCLYSILNYVYDCICNACTAPDSRIMEKKTFQFTGAACL